MLHTVSIEMNPAESINNKHKTMIQRQADERNKCINTKKQKWPAMYHYMYKSTVSKTTLTIQTVRINNYWI